MTGHGRTGGFIALTVAVTSLVTPARAHHSFAMYDTTITRVVTGVVSRVIPAPNHLKILFAPMTAGRDNVLRDADGEPVIWSVEMEGSAQMAKQGVSVNTFPPGTVFSIGLHPLRDGGNAGAREGAIFKCPGRTRPQPGLHCDSVPGHTAIGGDTLAKVNP